MDAGPVLGTLLTASFVDSGSLEQAVAVPVLLPEQFAPDRSSLCSQGPPGRGRVCDGLNSIFTTWQRASSTGTGGHLLGTAEDPSWSVGLWFWLTQASRASLPTGIVCCLPAVRPRLPLGAGGAAFGPGAPFWALPGAKRGLLPTSSLMGLPQHRCRLAGLPQQAQSFPSKETNALGYKRSVPSSTVLLDVLLPPPGTAELPSDIAEPPCGPMEEPYQGHPWDLTAPSPTWDPQSCTLCCGGVTPASSCSICSSVGGRLTRSIPWRLSLDPTAAPGPVGCTGSLWGWDLCRDSTVLRPRCEHLRQGGMVLVPGGIFPFNKVPSATSPNTPRQRNADVDHFSFLLFIEMSLCPEVYTEEKAVPEGQRK